MVAPIVICFIFIRIFSPFLGAQIKSPAQALPIAGLLFSYNFSILNYLQL